MQLPLLNCYRKYKPYMLMSRASIYFISAFLTSFSSNIDASEILMALIAGC